MTHRATCLIATATAAGMVLSAAPAFAQSMSTNSAQYNGGFNHAAGSENHAIALSGSRDANGNRTIIDGLIQTGAATVSARAASYASATGSVSGGVGGGDSASSGGATAVGNSLTVITQGNYNTVIVNSVQTNSGEVIASTNGGVGQ